MDPQATPDPRPEPTPAQPAQPTQPGHTMPEHPKADSEGGIESVMPEPRFNPWAYREDVPVAGASLIGYKVEATDGTIGRVDHASYDVDAAFLVVETGHWIFGKKLMIPAGTVNHVDHNDKRVYVDRSKDQIKSAPEYDQETHMTEEYRDKIGSYYGDMYGMPGVGGAVFPPGVVPPGMIPPDRPPNR